MAIDGTCFDVPDSKVNADYSGYPSSSRGDTAFPQLRVVGLVETGTHIIVAAQVRPYKCSAQEMTAALKSSGKFTPEILIMADRNFYGYKLWKQAVSTGANLLWRIKSNPMLPAERRLSDNSCISTVYDSRDRTDCTPIKVRIIEYKLKGKNNPDKDQIYRLITNIFNHIVNPAKKLAALSHERREMESIYDEVKISLSANTTIIRSKIPELVIRDVWGLMLIHFAIRQLMSETTWDHKRDPGELSFKGAVHTVRRKLPQATAFSPGEAEDSGE
jgi:hypothetical protein